MEHNLKDLNNIILQSYIKKIQFLSIFSVAKIVLFAVILYCIKIKQILVHKTDILG